MGGGGGGGQQNNSVGTSGTDGGGIVLINATQIVTSGACSAHSISANGLSANNANNDGSGGGGAGGTIIFDVGSFSIPASCPLTVTADGGNGGSSIDGATHGGGGGGGQGRVIFSGATPANVTVSTNNGISGCNNNSSPCSSQAPSPGGANGIGISDNGGNTPLPVSLVYFTGYYNKQAGLVELKWATASELNNHYFTIESSMGGRDFTEIARIPGGGNTATVSRYEVEDTQVFGDSRYYRLSQTDFDGTREYLMVIRIYWEKEIAAMCIYPNPIEQSGQFIIDVEGLPIGNYALSLTDSNGIEVFFKEVVISDNFQSLEIKVAGFSTGLYSVRLHSTSHSYQKKLMVR
jgi:hypothetical protein